MPSNNLRGYKRTFQRQVLAAENRHRDKVYRALNAQVNAFFAYAENVGVDRALETIDTVVTERPIANVLEPLFKREGMAAIRAEQNYLNATIGSEYKAFNWSVNWSKLISSFFYTIGLRDVRNITETTREMLRNRIFKGVSENKTLQEIRREIVTDQINRTRANVITRTEVITVTGYGKQSVALNAPILMRKQWATVLDGRERKTHELMNGEQRDLTERYSNGAMYPGDPDLPAKERIQCRCTEIYIPVRDAYGRLIRK